MKEFVEKLIGRLEEYPTYSFGVSLLNTKEYIKVSDLIEIVNQLAEEYRQDLDKNSQGWISCSGCSDCKHKECENYGKV